MIRRRRSGFSLMEVLLAVSILTGSLIVLGELAAVGRQHARDAEQLTAAQLFCRSRLNEIVSGAAPLESQPASVVPELPGWSCHVQVEPVGEYDLQSVTVTVTRDQSAALDTKTSRKGKSFALTRWVYTKDHGSLAGEELPP
jgi:prepilin-type N-terminal cleavage/methylation domain-containing protein